MLMCDQHWKISTVGNYNYFGITIIYNLSVAYIILTLN